METKLILLFAVVLVASGCASNSTDSPENTDTPSEDPQNPPVNDTDTSDTEPSGEGSNTTTVTYTDSGFQPGTVTVQQGETVVWESEASRSMWVGSDRHPVHSQYSGSSLQEHCSNGDQNSRAFDQCSTGDRFSFTFEKTGEWSYHNHEYSTHTGTVIVE